MDTVLLTGAALAHVVAGIAAGVARAPGGAAWFVGAVLLGLLSLAEHTGLHYRLAELGENLGAVLLLAAALGTVTVPSQRSGLRLRYRAAPVPVPLVARPSEAVL